MNGYNETFLGNKVVLPKIDKILYSHFSSSNQKKDNFYLNYINYSLLQSPLRKFPVYTATNIDGSKFIKIRRADLFGGNDKWVKDDRIKPEYQFGKELYSAYKSNFDRGHLTKREDTQWGNDLDHAKMAAISTFYYTNAVPQMAKLNRGIWKDIEDYILHDETIENSEKIVMFSGPFLNDNDPYFVTKIENKKVKLPTLFWKIVFYKNNGDLYKTGFVVGQKNEMIKKGVIHDQYREDDDEHKFQNFKDSETYQVGTKFIEKSSGLEFGIAEEVYVDSRPTKLILSETDVRDELIIPSKILNIRL